MQDNDTTRHKVNWFMFLFLVIIGAAVGLVFGIFVYVSAQPELRDGGMGIMVPYFHVFPEEHFYGQSDEWSLVYRFFCCSPLIFLFIGGIVGTIIGIIYMFISRLRA